MLALLASEGDDAVAETSERGDGNRPDATGRTADYHRPAAGPETVLFHACDGQGGSEAGVPSAMASHIVIVGGRRMSQSAGTRAYSA